MEEFLRNMIKKDRINRPFYSSADFIPIDNIDILDTFDTLDTLNSPKSTTSAHIDNNTQQVQPMRPAQPIQPMQQAQSAQQMQPMRQAQLVQPMQQIQQVPLNYTQNNYVNERERERERDRDEKPRREFIPDSSDNYGYLHDDRNLYANYRDDKRNNYYNKEKRDDNSVDKRNNYYDKERRDDNSVDKRNNYYDKEKRELEKAKARIKSLEDHAIYNIQKKGPFTFMKDSYVAAGAFTHLLNSLYKNGLDIYLNQECYTNFFEAEKATRCDLSDPLIFMNFCARTTSFLKGLVNAKMNDKTIPDAQLIEILHKTRQIVFTFMNVIGFTVKYQPLNLNSALQFTDKCNHVSSVIEKKPIDVSDIVNAKCQFNNIVNFMSFSLA
jgi:hypothetical protein